MSSTILRASRYMSWALRHSPEEADLQLDTHGWVSIQDLLRSMQQHGHSVAKEAIATIVADDPKRRYSIDGQMIRANYGHSTAIQPDVASEPPATLYHGTVTTNLAMIKRDGLLAQRRRYVHLSDDVDHALSIGLRYGKPAVIPIDAAAMQTAGLSFYRAAPTVWLTATVPPRYLRLADVIFSDHPAV